VFLCFIFIGCLPKVNSQSDLKLIETIALKIPEPSGITAYENHLYIVSDQNGTIYKCTLKGETIKKMRTQISDLEGITINPVSEKIIVINEVKRSLITLNFDGSFVKKKKIKGKQDNKNHGLEGITFDTSSNNFYALNEKSPKQLLKLSLKGEIKDKYHLDFSKDISGICYDEKKDNLWVISDESKAIYQISKKGKLKKKYKIGIEKGEGIVIYNNLIYVVNDYLNSLYVFEMVD